MFDLGKVHPNRCPPFRRCNVQAYYEEQVNRSIRMPSLPQSWVLVLAGVPDSIVFLVVVMMQQVQS